jgi:Carbohydrate esterase, sialic acid-specific acetylesterase
MIQKDKMMKIDRTCVVAMALLLAVAVIGQEKKPASGAKKKPLKVFILAGQSNMVGMGSVSTFPAIGMDPATAPILKDILDKDGNPVVCEEVYICKPGGEDPDNAKAPEEKFGKLEVGYGGGKGVRVGPEYGFGIYAYKMLREPILIIKTARGGRDLFNQFRPPSAGPLPPPDEATIEGLKKKGGDLEAEKTRRLNKDGGLQYRWMMDYVKNVLKDPKRVCPAYDPEAGFELAGFAWLQGYNDFIGGNYPYVDPNAGKASLKDYSEYTRLLGCFIRDIRKELNAPKLPFVIGVFGMDGKQPKNPNITAFRKAQAATAELPEFKGNVVNIMLEDFWPEEISKMMDEVNALMRTKGKVNLQGEALAAWNAYKTNKDLMEGKDQPKTAKKKKGKDDGDDGDNDTSVNDDDANDTDLADSGNKKLTKEQPQDKNPEKNQFKERFRADKELKKKFYEVYFGPEKAKLLEVGMSNQGYHYWGSAKFYTLSGKAFAEKLVEINLTRGQLASPSIDK